MAGHLGEVQQPLLSKRPKERVAPWGLLLLEGRGPGLGPSGSCSVPTVLSRATEMGEGQAVLWGRAGGPVPACTAGQRGWEARWHGCGEEKERGLVRTRGMTHWWLHQGKPSSLEEKGWVVLMLPGKTELSCQQEPSLGCCPCLLQQSALPCSTPAGEMRCCNVPMESQRLVATSLSGC